jgi:alpha-aminoadipic semialdehyde synthase
MLRIPLKSPRVFSTQFVATRAYSTPVIGIRRETKHKWERRAPLLPSHVENLSKDGIQVIVQPSNNRIIGDERYRKVRRVFYNATMFYGFDIQ